MRSDAIFIGVEVEDGAAADAEVAAKLSDACPVDIFKQADDGSLAIVSENLDECVLCGLCIEAVPGSVTIHKLYDAGAVLS